MRSVRHLLLALFVSGLVAGASRATFFYEFALNSTSPAVSTPITIAQGTSLPLEVYIRESGGTVLATQKMFGAGVRVTFDTPPGSGTPSGIVSTSPSAVSSNPAFNNPSSLIIRVGPNNPASVDLIETQSGIPGTVAPDPTFNRVYVGRFTFTGLSLGQAVVTARDTGSNDNITGTGTSLLGQIQTGSATFIVSAVPEPTSLALTGLAASGFLGAVIRRRRQAKHRGQMAAPPSEPS
jgi:hypothetical protein